MRILTLSNVPLEDRLGSAYVILNFAKGMRERGHQVDVVGPEILERAKFLRRGKLQRLAWGMRGFVARHALEGQYDVVELYGGPTCYAAQKLYGIKDRRFLVVAHSNGIEMHASEQTRAAAAEAYVDRKRRMGRWLDLPVKRSFTDVDGIVTVGNFDLEYAARERLKPKSRLVAIENALPDDYLGLAVRWEREPVLGFCGAWLGRKGIACLTAGLPMILDSWRNVRVRLIGVGVEFNKEAHFPSTCCDRIEVIKTSISRAELRRQYEDLAVLMMPSWYESFGMVACEAMACGAALVATRTGFAASLVDGEEALLMERCDGTALAGAVNRLLANEPLRRRIAENGWKRVQGLRWDRSVEVLERTFVRWLGELRDTVEPAMNGRMTC